MVRGGFPRAARDGLRATALVDRDTRRGLTAVGAVIIRIQRRIREEAGARRGGRRRLAVSPTVRRRGILRGVVGFILGRVLFERDCCGSSLFAALLSERQRCHWQRKRDCDRGDCSDVAYDVRHLSLPSLCWWR